MNGRLIRIRPYHGLGNQMFQFMLAEVIRRRVSDARIVGHDIAPWGLRAEDGSPAASFSLRIRGHVAPLGAIVALANAVAHVDVVIETLSCRTHHYADDRAALGALFPVAPPAATVGPDELLINVRGDEIMSGAHANYMPLPIVWYERLIAETGLRPVLVGQIGDDSYSAALRRRLPSARVIADLGPRATFDLIRSARNVAVAISTFSWLAAWLSDEAANVFLPVAGLFNPTARPDVDLLPIGDARYRFHAMPLTRWTGAPSELATLIDGDVPTAEIGSAALARAYEGVLGPAGALRGAPALT